MRIYLLLSLFLLYSTQLFTQQDLSGSRKSSYYTRVYRISPSETIDLFTSDMEKAGDKYLHTLVDSFATDKEDWSGLKEGNYLFVKAAGNHLSYALKTIGNLRYKLLNNNRDLVIALHNRQGLLITDALVSVNHKAIPFDAITKTYRLNKRKRTGLIKVNYGDVLYLFPLAKEKKYYYRRQFFARLSNSFPLKYITRPIRNLLNHSNYYNEDYFNGSTNYEKGFTGYMVFSKPKYKPGDTVYLKAWVMNKKGRPVNRPLLLRLTDRGLVTDTILTTLHPYRPGGYEYQFVITDSLDLSLDDQHLITLEESKSRKYSLEDYNGDLDDGEYALLRKVLMRGKFDYEEYELGSIRFTARVDKEVHHRGNPPAVYLKATDENDMAVMDGRIQVLVTPGSYSAPRFYGKQVFLPDTLWSYNGVLEPMGETKIVLPDSIFPQASISYTISCVFLNSNNELKSRRFDLEFDNDIHKIYFTVNADTLRIQQRNAEAAELATGVLYGFDEKDDTLLQQSLQLPASIAVNPFVKYYTVVTGSSRGKYQLQQSRGMLSCVAARTKDSVYIQAVNPGRLFFWYSIFAGNRMIRRGFGDSLLYTVSTATAKNYFVSLQYVYANRVYNEDYTVPYQNKLLNIQVQQPEYVYPGQKVQINMTVTGSDGKPVRNADITAYAFTEKFEKQRAPFVPYLGKIYGGRKLGRIFFAQQPEAMLGSARLNWQRWSREMGLDSIEYYKFLHPQKIYSNTEPAADSITQIAPFVVLNGDLQPVHQIYIDETPYFFSQAQQLQRYSFRITPGKHALRLRTRHQMIILDSVWAWKGVKTFICINADTAVNKMIRTVHMPDSLNNYEKGLWSKYMLLVENNFGETPAVITQSDRLYLLNPPLNQPFNTISGRSSLAGPFLNQNAVLNVKTKFSQSFEPEGNYLFDIAPGFIKQKQLPFGKYSFRPQLSAASPDCNFHDLVLTEKELDSLWRDYLDHRSANEDLFRNETLNKYGNGQLRLGIGSNAENKPVFVKNIFLFCSDDSDFVRVYKGASADLGYLQPARYRVFILLKNDDYFIMDSIAVQRDGVNYYHTGTILPIKKDRVSIKIAAIVNSREKKWWSTTLQDADLGMIRESFNEKYLDAANLVNSVSGIVRDAKDGFPVAGAYITVKGTKLGTVADAQGRFMLKVPEKGTIVISSVGFNTVEKRISEGPDFDIKLRLSSRALNEVVVVGFGTSLKRSLAGAVSMVDAGSMLAGKAAGVQITIRGAASMTAGSNPLVIVDGLPYNGKIADLDEALIAGVNVLPSTAATALYGSTAKNGVIIITTKKGNAGLAIAGNGVAPLPGNVLRKNFRDAAYWQPRLQTDADGKASFTTVFPDDITRWRTFAIAMAGKRQSGFAEKSVKSFKAISAGLSMPVFAVEEDTFNVIGKILNYTNDSIRMQRQFRVNNEPAAESSLSLLNSHIDTFTVTAGKPDTLKIIYTASMNNGYSDGEERVMPVFKQGVQETRGYFAALGTDTSFSLSFDTTMGRVKLHAESSLLPVMLDEIEKIHQYEYLCNEQLASKLKALLLKKKIYRYLQKTFAEEKNITALIGKLNQSKSREGLWGWWSNNEPSGWISLHAGTALLLAAQEGYAVNINKQLMIGYLVYNERKFSISEKLSSLQLLKALGAQLEFSKYTDSLEKKTAVMNLNEQLQFLQLKQELGMPVVFDSLLKKYNRTMIGNWYWGEDNNRFFDNSVQNSLLMYRLMRSAGSYEKQMEKIRNYFLEKRRGGQWRNTYESSLILETILPELVKEGSAEVIPELSINGAAPVYSFPYKAEISPSEKLSIKKSGNLPVYFTTYQQYWNAAPEKVNNDFSVNSTFEINGQKIKSLKAGQPVVLKVDVTVKADADYVMIEIPVPAGCSYGNKSQQYQNNEVHREYFKNKVSIFCSFLRKGNYIFTVSLMPRYTGSYRLNPAKAEMMYFPVFYGREGMKTVKIE